MAERKLSPRQKIYVDALIETGCKKTAADRAGYCPSYTYRASMQRAVVEEIARRQAELGESAKEVLAFLAEVMRGNVHPSRLRGDAAFQLGKRAGLWLNHNEMDSAVRAYIEEKKGGLTHE